MDIMTSKTHPEISKQIVKCKNVNAFLILFSSTISFELTFWFWNWKSGDQYFGFLKSLRKVSVGMNINVYKKYVGCNMLLCGLSYKLKTLMDTLYVIKKIPYINWNDQPLSDFVYVVLCWNTKGTFYF